MICPAVILLCLALAGCCPQRASQQTQSAELGAEVTLAPGAAVSVKAATLTVRFVAVTEDSRCPRDVTCVWQGEVKVRLEIQASSKASSEVEVLGGGSSVVGAYRVTVVESWAGGHEHGQNIAPQNYRATLKIDRSGQP